MINIGRNGMFTQAACNQSRCKRREVLCSNGEVTDAAKPRATIVAFDHGFIGHKAYLFETYRRAFHTATSQSHFFLKVYFTNIPRPAL